MRFYEIRDLWNIFHDYNNERICSVSKYQTNINNVQ